MLIRPIHCSAMQHQDFIIPSNKKITNQALETAISAIPKLPLSKMQNSKQILSEALYTLSAYWDDEFASKGLLLAELLIKNGADPHQQKITAEDLELGKSSNYKHSFYEYRQTPYLVARGALLTLFKKEITTSQDHL